MAAALAMQQRGAALQRGITVHYNKTVHRPLWTLRCNDSPNNLIGGSKSLAGKRELRVSAIAGDKLHGNGVLPFLTNDDDVTGAINWEVLHGKTDWAGLTDPLNNNLRQHIIKYGELAQVTYDSFVSELRSKYVGKTRWPAEQLLQNTLAPTSAAKGYTIITDKPSNCTYDPFMYANSGFYNLSTASPEEEVRRVAQSDAWKELADNRPNWIGYVSVSPPDKVTGKHDIAVAFRGTITSSEWVTDIWGNYLEPWDESNDKMGKVHHGFNSMYTRTVPIETADGPVCMPPPSQVVYNAIRYLACDKFKGKVQSITTTGHSLGGALAILSAFDIKDNLNKLADASSGKEATDIRNIRVGSVTFASPRVGDNQFRDALNGLGVKVLRMVNVQDVVPVTPGILNTQITKMLQRAGVLGQQLAKVFYWPFGPWAYRDVGTKVEFDNANITCSDGQPLLREFKNKDVGPRHNLELYLYMVATQLANPDGPRPTGRDYALMNKSDDILAPERGIPISWWQPQLNKGMAVDNLGRWREV